MFVGMTVDGIVSDFVKKIAQLEALVTKRHAGIQNHRGKMTDLANEITINETEIVRAERVKAALEQIVG